LASVFTTDPAPALTSVHMALVNAAKAPAPRSFLEHCQTSRLITAKRRGVGLSAGSDPLTEFNHAIRPEVSWRKASFGTQSAEGSRFVEAIRTLGARLKQQNRLFLNYLTTACEAAPAYYHPQVSSTDSHVSPHHALKWVNAYLGPTVPWRS
jgi:hypothetical protein